MKKDLKEKFIKQVEVEKAACEKVLAAYGTFVVLINACDHQFVSTFQELFATTTGYGTKENPYSRDHDGDRERFISIFDESGAITYFKIVLDQKKRIDAQKTLGDAYNNVSNITKSMRSIKVCVEEFDAKYEEAKKAEEAYQKYIKNTPRTLLRFFVEEKVVSF